MTLTDHSLSNTVIILDISVHDVLSNMDISQGQTQFKLLSLYVTMVIPSKCVKISAKYGSFDKMVILVDVGEEWRCPVQWCYRFRCFWRKFRISNSKIENWIVSSQAKGITDGNMRIDGQLYWSSVTDCKSCCSGNIQNWIFKRRWGFLTVDDRWWPKFSETIWNKVTDSQIFYSAGFFLTPTEGLPTLMKIAHHARESNKVGPFRLYMILKCFFLDFLHEYFCKVHLSSIQSSISCNFALLWLHFWQWSRSRGICQS